MRTTYRIYIVLLALSASASSWRAPWAVGLLEEAEQCRRA